jgi:hypothetical protein
LKKSIFALISLIALCSFGQSVKNLAGPATDYLGKTSSLPSPVSAGIRSQGAFIPVYFDETGVWNLNIPFEGEGGTLIFFNPENTKWNPLISQTSQKKAMELDQFPGVEMSQRNFGLNEIQIPCKVAHFSESHHALSLNIHADGLSAKKQDQPNGYVYVIPNSPFQIFSHLKSYNLLLGREIGLKAFVFQSEKYPNHAIPQPDKGTYSANMTIIAPSGQRWVETMTPLNDGSFDGSFEPMETGDYIVRIMLEGTNLFGQKILRSSTHLIPVLEPQIELADLPVASKVLDNNRVELQIPLLDSDTDLEKVLVYAEVWGTNAQGSWEAMSWISGISPLQQDENGLSAPAVLDVRWAALNGLNAPFELRNIRIQDVDTHIPLSQLPQLSVAIHELPGGASKTVTRISDEMLYGKRPVVTQSNFHKSGPKLMLVHGYCSGRVWFTSHFTGAVEFQDYEQNRSHDAFANLIRNFGSSYSSFGIVAHSQGGCASLHLYTYYWSGLDYSSGDRLIQSVGTPYRGTAIAGILADLGAIFGVQCGSQWDLTYDGASLWLSGIPSWARSRVYYSTTSFTDKWWRYDYCNAATDLTLDDPDDGVIEKWGGQLSGATNKGHKTGWCHTLSMRDPGQTTDRSRNNDMNAHANR